MKFEYSQGIEFANTLLWGLSEEYAEKIADDAGFELPIQGKEQIEVFKENISSFMWNDIRYFSNILQLEMFVLHYVISYGVNNIDEVLVEIEKRSVETLFSYVGRNYISKHMKKSHNRWKEVHENLEEMILFIENNTEENQGQKILLECMKNPEETKERIIYVLRNIYNRAFKVIETNIIEEINKKCREYQEEASEDFEAFKEKYFLVNAKEKRCIEEFQFKVSFMQIAPVIEHTIDEEHTVAVVSTYALEMKNKGKSEDEIRGFLKALSDSKKISIIRMLSKRAEYGYRIAEELNITPATVNYHVNILLGTGILDLDKSENKIYYSVNKERFREMMKKAEKYLLCD